ncbi:MAG: DNA double-strand break repair nuclease NurA [Candidatus Njordarchaeia archaeon]
MLDFDIVREHLNNRKDDFRKYFHMRKIGRNRALELLDHMNKRDLLVRLINEKNLELNALEDYAYPSEEVNFKKFKLAEAPALELLRNWQVIAVDGSQIYPDPHLSLFMAVINIGWITLLYNDSNTEYHSASEPQLLTPSDFLDLNLGILRYSFKEHIDYIRLVGELQKAKELAEASVSSNKRTIIMLDGPIIFSFLEPRNKRYIEKFLTPLLELIEYCDRKGIYIIGYLATSRSREVSNLLRYLFLCKYPWPRCNSCIEEHGGIYKIPCSELINVTDVSLYGTYLNRNERSSVFLSRNRKILDFYKHYKDKIGLFYIKDSNNKVSRIELPIFDWYSEKDLQDIANIVSAQAKLGLGYPYALLRAHEAAVIKSKDRELFYRILDKFMYENFGIELKETPKRKYKRESII